MFKWIFHAYSPLGYFIDDAGKKIMIISKIENHRV